MAALDHTTGEGNNTVPRHIAIILDGNGRWAKKRGLPRTAGHAAGAETFRKIATYCKNIGVNYLTVYAFSTENWSRPEEEVKSIMKLLDRYLREAIATMERDHIRMKILGDVSILSPALRAEIEETNKISSRYEGFQANICQALCPRSGGRESISGSHGGGLFFLSLFCRDSRSGSPDSPRRRKADFQFPAVAMCLQRVLFYRCSLAGFFTGGTGQGYRRVQEERSSVWRR